LGKGKEKARISIRLWKVAEVTKYAETTTSKEN
jgi:hypothetical protein